MYHLVHTCGEWAELGQNGLKMGASFLLEHHKWSKIPFRTKPKGVHTITHCQLPIAQSLVLFVFAQTADANLPELLL